MPTNLRIWVAKKCLPDLEIMCFIFHASESVKSCYSKIISFLVKHLQYFPFQKQSGVHQNFSFTPTSLSMISLFNSWVKLVLYTDDTAIYFSRTNLLWFQNIFEIYFTSSKKYFKFWRFSDTPNIQAFIRKNISRCYLNSFTKTVVSCFN